MPNTALDAAYELLKTGAFEEAVEAFAACIATAPQEPGAYRGRALAQFQLKQWEAAAGDFARALELDPAELDNRVGLGMSLAMTHRVYEAVDILEALVGEHPAYVRGRIQLGLLYYRLCVTAKGREQLEAALASRPTLDERRCIEQKLKEEKQLDQKRYYRPDFEALRKRQSGKS